MSMLRRILVPFLVVAVPVAAMLAYMFYALRAKTMDTPAAAPTQAASFGTSTWPIFRGDRQLTGRAKGILPDRLTLAWEFPTGGAVRGTPVAADGTVYAASTDKRVYALDLRTGKPLWQAPLDGEIEASPLIVDDRLYVGTMEGTLFALDRQNGKPLWSFESRDKIVGSVNSADVNGQTLILLGSYDGTLYALDTSGTLQWRYETDSYINGTPAVFDGRAAVGGCDAYLHLVSLTDPNDVRKVDTGSYIPSSPAVLDGMAYVGNFEGRLMGIDTAGAAITWTYDNKDVAFFAVPAVNESTVIAGTREGRLIVLDRATGRELRTFTAGDAIDSSPVICGGRVLFGSDDGRLYMVDIESAREIWSYTLGQPIASSPAVVAGCVLVGCDDGNVYAFRQD